MIEMEDLKRGVKKYATPLYVYDLVQVRLTFLLILILVHWHMLVQYMAMFLPDH